MAVEQGKLHSLGPAADARAILDAALRAPADKMIGLAYSSNREADHFSKLAKLLKQPEYQALEERLYFFPLPEEEGEEAPLYLDLEELATFVGSGGYVLDLGNFKRDLRLTSLWQQHLSFIDQGCPENMIQRDVCLTSLKGAYDQGHAHDANANTVLSQAQKRAQEFCARSRTSIVQVSDELKNIQERLKKELGFTLTEISEQAALEITWVENGDQRKVTCTTPPEAPQDVEYQSLPQEGGMAAIAKVLAAQFKDQPIPLEEVSDLPALIAVLPETCRISTQDLSEKSKQALRAAYGLSGGAVESGNLLVSALRKNQNPPERILDTVADGNCGYNAIALAMKIQYLAEEDHGPWHRWLASGGGELFRRCFCEKRGTDLQNFSNDWEIFCKTQDDQAFQKALAPVLRQLNYAYSYQKMGDDLEFSDRLLMVIQVDMIEALKKAISRNGEIDVQRQYFVSDLEQSIPNQEVRERIAFYITEEEWENCQSDPENIDAFVSKKFSKDMLDHSLLEHLISAPFEPKEYASQNGLGFLAESMGMKLTIQKNRDLCPYGPEAGSDRSIFIYHSGLHWSAMAYQSDLDKVAAKQQRSGMPPSQFATDESFSSSISSPHFS